MGKYSFKLISFSKSIHEQEERPALFQKLSDCDVFNNSPWDNWKSGLGSKNNVFVEDGDPDISDLSDYQRPRFEMKHQSLVKPTFEQKPTENSTPKFEGVNKSPESQFDAKVDPVSDQVNNAKKFNIIQKLDRASNSRKPTMDVSDAEKSADNTSHRSEYTPSSNIKKRRKRRRDVIFKTILRECRRYFQIQLSNLTGFITSKKPRNDDYMYSCMKRFNIEALGKQGTFEENFYLACLLYPQDLMRNIDSFIKEKGAEDFESAKKEYKQISQKIHDTLYKYSHDKLDFFVSKPELSFLFCYFYEKGAGVEKEDPKYVEEYEFIRTKCMDSLNRKF